MGGGTLSRLTFLDWEAYVDKVKGPARNKVDHSNSFSGSKRGGSGAEPSNGRWRFQIFSLLEIVENDICQQPFGKLLNLHSFSSFLLQKIIGKF